MSDKYIYIKSYGCQMNVYDSNRIKDLFSNKGYKLTDDISKADLTVLNTCHIREKAVEKVYSDIGRVKKIKDKKQNMKLMKIAFGIKALICKLKILKIFH